MELKPRYQVDFSKKIHEWDGFGVNYVEAAQTRDYDANPQEYGGFSYLSEADRQQVIEMVFGPDGLQPGLVKMFMDSWHQPEERGPFDHDKTTRWMRYFVGNGLKKLREQGKDLEIFIGLFGPPAWTTRQKFVRGRDLDPAYKRDVAYYLVHWAKHLREIENYPVRYVGVHNEGEDWVRWPLDGSDWGGLNHDYNMYWPPEQVVEFMHIVTDVLREEGLEGLVSVTPGETSNWYRFDQWGYADALADDPEAVQKIGLITSHGFADLNYHHRWFGDWRSIGIDKIRAIRPDLKAWVTSTSWAQMDVFFINQMRNNIYAGKVNGIIPWATIQLQGGWVGGDPNPGTAFKVWEEGRYEVTHGYYLFKQVCRAGQPGMSVARVTTNDAMCGLMAFASNGTNNPDAFVVMNLAEYEQPMEIDIMGTASQQFEAFRTTDGTNEQYAAIGSFTVEDGRVKYNASPRSVTTFYGAK